ncbi:MAG: CvpA family protein [Pseudomonadota bacterium]
MSSTNLSLAVDIVVVILVIISAYLAMVRGFVREMFALLSWAAAFFAAFAFAAALQPMLKELPAVGTRLAESCGLSMAVAFVIVFGITLILTSIIIWLFSGSIRNTALSFFDQGVGFVYGALRGLVLVAVLFIAYEKTVPKTDQYAFVEQAATISVVRDAAGLIETMMPDEIPGWLQTRVDTLLAECGS